MPGREARGRALDRILELAVLLNADMTQSLAEQGLTPARVHLLWELHHRGPCTQRVLADALEVSPRNITGLVDALNATGFVTRERHPTDRRAALVSLTERGVRTAEEMVDGREQLADLLFERMPTPQFDGLVEGLDAVLGRLRAAIADAKGGARS